MDNLTYLLMLMCTHNCDGSFMTQADRRRLLSLIARQLLELGYRHMSANSLACKHVDALVARWKEEGIDAGTFKNRMGALRWWAEKVGKRNLMKRTNREYGIPNRVFVAAESKAKALDAANLSIVTDEYTAMSLRLQATFGLRREESIKVKPDWADLGDRLRLKRSWTKGGRYREVTITTAEQRAALNAAKNLAGKGSLIPADMSYVDQLNRFKAQCAKAGIDNVHGLRHHYAQARYEALAGWKSPLAGGPSSKQLTPEQQAIDKFVRLTISSELGHGRESVTTIYLGR